MRVQGAPIQMGHNLRRRGIDRYRLGAIATNQADD